MFGNEIHLTYHTFVPIPAEIEILKGTVSPLNKRKLEIWLFLPILVHNTGFEQVQLSLNMEISKRFLYKLFICLSTL